MKTLIALFLFCASSMANATVYFEALGGQCSYTEVGNYIWQNDKYPHSKDLTSGCGLIGFASIGRNDGTTAVGWRLSYVELGTSRMNGIYPVIDEEQLLPAFDGSGCDYPRSFHGCLGSGITKQTARGFSAGAVIERKVKSLYLGVEGGAYLYDGEFNARITPVNSGDWGPWNVRWRGLQATPYYGFSVRGGIFMVMFRQYGRIKAAQHGCGGCSGHANGPADQILIGVSVPL